MTELKIQILTRFCQQDESLNIDSFVKAVLCIDAYETSGFCLGKRKLEDSADWPDQPPPSA